ncbi:MAG: hypothetical protein AB7S65_04060 [Sulfuricurvum sp.]
MILVAIPLDAMNRVYHMNPCTSPMFAIYELDGKRSDLRYRHVETRLNPWEKTNGSMVCDPVMKACGCDPHSAQDPHHVCEHYAVLEVVGKCNYLIVDQYCLNTLHTMKNVGIKVHKIPPFITTAEAAIKHFVIAANFADHLESINPAS